MQLIDRSNAGEIAGQNTAIALGTFDGLHVGHQELIKTLKSNAAGLKTMASTFSNIPASFLTTISVCSLRRRRRRARLRNWG